MTYIIKEPIWNSGKRCVGIAEFRIKHSLDKLIKEEK